MRPILFVLSLCAAAACGEVKTDPDTGVTPATDGGVAVDAPDEPPVDAATDAPPTDAPPTPPPPPGTARELTVVGGAVADTRFHLQLEITGGVAAQRAANATTRFDSATTVTVPRGGN